MMVAISTGRIPLSVKLLYTLFVAVLVPVYLRTYGPTNFLYFCDIALFMTLAALWLESALLVSAAAVARKSFAMPGKPSFSAWSA